MLEQAKSKVTDAISSLENDTRSGREDYLSNLEKMREHLEQLVDDLEVRIDAVTMELRDEEA